MRYGFVLPGGTAVDQLEQGVLADQSGWDGVFVWEAAYGVDAWALLAAMAQRTTHVRLGTMLTPLPWRRPWHVAAQVSTVDQLSGGRAILAVGLGAADPEMGTTGEENDRRVRAELLDEGLDIIAALWAGQLRYAGRHYHLDLQARTDLPQVATPVQQPRIPIWVVGAWPRPKSMRRVLRCDGLLPTVIDEQGSRQPTPADVMAIRSWLNQQQTRPDRFDIVVDGETPADDPRQASETVAQWQSAGATWWLETRWAMPHDSTERMAEVRSRLAAGPPGRGDAGSA